MPTFYNKKQTGPNVYAQLGLKLCTCTTQHVLELTSSIQGHIDMKLVSFALGAI